MPVVSPEFAPVRAEDALSREVPPGHALDFVQGCKVFAEIIAKETPDIVLFPQRGAGPIEWTTAAFLDADHTHIPTMVDLPLGTHVMINEGTGKREGGMSGRSKISLIEEVFTRMQEDGVYVPGESRVMLIDEVQKGGTITQAAHAVRNAMMARGDAESLRVIAVQDSRANLIGDDRKSSYRKLASNEQAGVITNVVPTALFMVDRHYFLDAIWNTLPHEHGQLDGYVIMPNNEARSMFQTLVDVYRDPEQALKEIDAIERQDIAPDLGSTVLQTELLETITDPRSLRPKRSANTSHLLTWWRSYARKALQSRPQPQRTLD